MSNKFNFLMGLLKKGHRTINSMNSGDIPQLTQFLKNN